MQITDFKIGDRVRRTVYAYIYAEVGTLGTVVALDGQSINVLWDGKDRPAGCWPENAEVVPQIVEKSTLPEDSAARKTFPVCTGLLDYFPDALCAVAHHSYMGNEKHNPGEPMHWSRDKSTDHLDAAVRHIIERDLEGAAWRILAALQMKLESEGAPQARGAK